jgi:hypothetical protein
MNDHAVQPPVSVDTPFARRIATEQYNTFAQYSQRVDVEQSTEAKPCLNVAVNSKSATPSLQPDAGKIGGHLCTACAASWATASRSGGGRAGPCACGGTACVATGGPCAAAAPAASGSASDAAGPATCNTGRWHLWQCSAPSATFVALRACEW